LKKPTFPYFKDYDWSLVLKGFENIELNQEALDEIKRDFQAAKFLIKNVFLPQLEKSWVETKVFETAREIMEKRGYDILNFIGGDLRYYT
jgi:hypothetical protein